MGLPVLALNPSPAKGKRMAKRKMKWGDVGLLVLGSVAVAGTAYAIDAFNMSKLMSGGVKLLTGALVGGGVAMVSPPVGAGIAGGGIALGTYDIAGEALGGLAKANSKNNNNSETKSIRANIGAIGVPVTRKATRTRKALPTGTQRGRMNVSDAARAVTQLRAIKANFSRRSA